MKEKSDMLFFADVLQFDLKELDGKTLKMTVGDNEFMTVLMGHDIATGNIYLIDQRFKKGDK